MVSELRILVICNADADAEEIGKDLLRAGYDVSLHWANGEKGLQDALGEGDYDLVLCEDQTTGLDIVTARGLITESGLDIPFMVISGTMTPEAQQIASQMKAGVDDFVEWGKPERLIPAIERALQSSENRRQNRLAEQEIHYRANFDSLTDLPNRTLMLDRLSQAMKKARRDDSGVLLMYLDLDHFKPVNDSMGHLAGDLLLQKAARRISGCLRDTDTAARIGGDEFAIILPDAHDAITARSISGKLLKAFSKPFALDSQPASVTASIGITVFPDDGQDAETLLRNADDAMYAAKRAGRNGFKIFSDLGDAPTGGPVSDQTASLPVSRPLTLGLGLALAAALALVVVATTWMTSMNTKESLKIAIEDGMETLTDLSTASGPDD
ncbi:MAG: diguanylate cyclase response regulator [Rhodospirillales bacterium]|nr:diguanylate cyclase response regulator [Rhodospirillales bacterium]